MPTKSKSKSKSRSKSKSKSHSSHKRSKKSQKMFNLSSSFIILICMVGIGIGIYYFVTWYNKYIYNHALPPAPGKGYWSYTPTTEYKYGEFNNTLWINFDEDVNGGKYPRITAYNVYQDDGEGGPYILAETEIFGANGETAWTGQRSDIDNKYNPSINIIVKSDLKSNTTYRFYITAVNAVGESPPSEILIGKTIKDWYSGDGN